MTSGDSCQTHVEQKLIKTMFKISGNQSGIVLPAWPHSKMFQGSIQVKYIIHGHIVMNFDRIKLSSKLADLFCSVEQPRASLQRDRSMASLP